jgi:hypothetical protein
LLGLGAAVPQLRCLHHQALSQVPVLKRLSSGLRVALTLQSLVARLCVMSCCVAVLLTVLACVGALAGGFSSTAESFFFCTVCLGIQLMRLGANVLVAAQRCTVAACASQLFLFQNGAG